MGAAIYLKLERSIPGVDHVGCVDGKAVGKAWHFLNDMAAKNGIVPLQDFLSMSAEDISNLVGEDAIQRSTEPIPVERWFEAKEALRAVESYLQMLRLDTSTASEDLVRDLNSYREVLTAATQSQVRFHLAFDF